MIIMVLDKLDMEGVGLNAEPVDFRLFFFGVKEGLN